jgi:ABC-2 type transport system ATP-binding protein
MTEAPAPAIELVGLGKSYAGRPALVEATLTVERGEIFGYVGPNGAGKTTTIKILAGLLKPTSGDARVLGKSVRESPLDVKARIGYVPESGAVFEKFSPAEYLTLVARLYGLPDALVAERRDHWLEAFGLAADRDRPMTALSKGTRQKVCWIAALMHEPDVLVLDEPLNSLDVESVALAKDLMARFAREGKTVFYSSHLIDIVAMLCTKVALVHRGRILASGTVEEVTTRFNASSLERVLLDLGHEVAPA